jgi:DNA-binding NtrC family response regulator
MGQGYRGQLDVSNLTLPINELHYPWGMADSLPPRREPGKAVPTLLIIDDEPHLLKALARPLSRQGYTVLTAPSGEEGLVVVEENSVDLTLVDLDLGDGMSGQQVLEFFQIHHPRIVCILITGHGSAQAAFRALKKGAYDYFEKPIMDSQRFMQVIRKGLEFQRLKEENDQLKAQQYRGENEHLIGNSAAIRSVLSMVRSVAKVPVSVMITGESGTGKERVARAIHAESANSDGPFIGVNCAAIPESLIEGELFGAEPGAYTGLQRIKKGYFEDAGDGTLLLDEIGHMPIQMQAKLLRVCNEREVVRLGSTRPIPIRCRILAATHVDLKAAVRDGTFREDLYFRLNVVEIRVPPLRERRDDVPLLTWFFINQYNQKFGMDVQSVSPEALDRLVSYDWRLNNVRELMNCIERAMVFTTGSVLEVSGLDLATRGEPHRAQPHTNSVATSKGGFQPGLLEMDYTAAKNEIVYKFSRWYLKDRLATAGWVITRAAELAGQQRPNMRRLMRRFNIDRPDAVNRTQHHHIRSENVEND